MNLIDLKERIAIASIPAALRDDRNVPPFELTPEERDFLLDAINATPQAQIDGAIAHDPGNYMGRIETIWAWLSVDDGGEGVCAAPMNGMTLPLIAADKTRLDQIHPIAKTIAWKFRKTLRLAKFTKREDYEIMQP